MEYCFCPLCKQNKFENKFPNTSFSYTSIWYKNIIENQKIYLDLVDDSLELSTDDFNIFITEYFKNNKKYRFNLYTKILINKLFECKRSEHNRTILMLGCKNSENSNIFKLNKDMINTICNVNATLKYYPLYQLVRNNVNEIISTERKCNKCEENCARYIESLNSFLKNGQIDSLLKSKRHQNSYKLLNKLNMKYGKY